MTGMKLLPFLLLTVAVGLPSHGATKTQRTRVPSIAPQASEMLRRMTDYTRGLERFRVYVETTREGILPSGQQLDSDQEFELSVQRPDRLRIDHLSGAGERQLFYDGKNLTIYTPKKNFYAVTPAPGTIREAVSFAYRRGIDVPLADFLSGHPAHLLTKGVTSGIYVGKSVVRGELTNHLAFRQKDIDWQVWIEDSDTPLPVKIIITDKGVKGTPKFTAYMTDWDTNPTFASDTFTFTPPEGAREIKFRELMSTPAKPGSKAPRR